MWMRDRKRIMNGQCASVCVCVCVLVGGNEIFLMTLLKVAGLTG